MLNKEQGGATNAEYGRKLIENLSKYLTDIFDKGFSDANLKFLILSVRHFNFKCLVIHKKDIKTQKYINHKAKRFYKKQIKSIRKLNL